MAGLKTYNLAGIRAAIFSQADWAPSNSPVAQDRVDEFINRAYFRMSEEAPFLFFESQIRMAIDPDVNKGSSTDWTETHGPWKQNSQRVLPEVLYGMRTGFGMAGPYSSMTMINRGG